MKNLHFFGNYDTISQDSTDLTFMLQEMSKHLERNAMFDADRDRDKANEPERETIQDADLSSLAQSDSLRLYLREISRIPLLSAGKESHLAERAEQGEVPPGMTDNLPV